MQCERCHKKKGTVLYRERMGEGGPYKTRELCATCAALLSSAREPEVIGTAVAGVFHPIFENENYKLPALYFPLLPSESIHENAVLRCPLCGMPAEEIGRTGIPGCSVCYTVFRDILLPGLRAYHGQARHEGKCAAVMREKKAKEARLMGLKKELKQAITMEAFERAVSLRDEIRKLEAELHREGEK